VCAIYLAWSYHSLIAVGGSGSGPWTLDLDHITFRERTGS
jgi:hypothetical protein